MLGALNTPTATPNLGIDRSAQELRSWVPVALRAPAPGHAGRWASAEAAPRIIRCA